MRRDITAASQKSSSQFRKGSIRQNKITKLSTIGQPCTVKVDSAGHLIYWQAEEKETDFLDLCFVRDVRTGKSARIPKEQRLKDSLRFGGPEDDNLLQGRTITIVHGANMVDIIFVNFVSSSVGIASEWTNALMRLIHNPLAVNASPMTFLEKQYMKICVQTCEDGKIPVRNILKYLSINSKEDKKRVLDALQSVGLPHGKHDSISPDKFSFEDFWAFYNRLCGRRDIDKIFAEIGVKERPYLNVEQLMGFLNDKQRDPRLNEILFPYCTTEKAQAIIDKHEPNKDFAKKGRFSVQGLTRYLMSDDNFVINLDHLPLNQDMTHPLSHYFINSSHNTYLTGHQLTGRSSVEMYRQALLAGCRCIELDCWDGRTEEQEPLITHGMTLCTEILFKDVIEAIADSAFKTSEYPVILFFENNCSPKQQAKMAYYCVNIFGDMLLDKPLDDFPLEEGKSLPHPKALMRKIVINDKKRPTKRGKSVDADKSAAVADSSGTPVTSPDSEEEEDEVAPEIALSALVNYIQTVDFKGFDACKNVNRSFEMSSFVETKAISILKESSVEFANYNKRQLSRIYPRGTRFSSENYMPQIFWNAGCQLVALNYQTFDLAMMLNSGIFEFNGGCGYILKPSCMCRADKSFDPFVESTVDGIIAASVSVISGQCLYEKMVGTYVEVDMFGLPADTVRRKFKTKVVPNNAINPVYDEGPFEFKKVFLPSLAVLRIAVYEEGGKLLGQRILPVNGLSPGYRHVKLRNESNQPLCLPTLFVHIVTKDFVPSASEDHHHLAVEQAIPRFPQARPSSESAAIVTADISSSYPNRFAHTKVEPATVKELKEQKAFIKLNQKHQKEIDILVKKHEKEKDKLQKIHLFEQEKFQKSLDREKVTTKKKCDNKELKKAEKKGTYEDSYQRRVQEMAHLTKDHDTKVLACDAHSETSSLKCKHRGAMTGLLKKQLNEQLELAEKQLTPKQEELERLMHLSQEKKMKLLADVHSKQLNDLRKGQDDHNREEMKLLSRQHRNKDELQRRKREENKKHIEQSVKERQKMAEFHKKEREELQKEHEQLFEALDGDRQKNLRDLQALHESKVKHLSVCDLEATYASLFGDKVTKL